MTGRPSRVMFRPENVDESNGDNRRHAGANAHAEGAGTP